jgi:Ala-tRNA(Pro) deacylase
MPADRARWFARLAELGIASTTVAHAPMFTVEESKALRGALPGAHTKTLFLIDKDDHMVLVVAKDDSCVDLKALAHRLGLGRFSFGNASLLNVVLGVSPGSVTPFALINDADVRVKGGRRCDPA